GAAGPARQPVPPPGPPGQPGTGPRGAVTPPPPFATRPPRWLGGGFFRWSPQPPPAYNGLHVHPALSACVVLRHAAGTVRPGSGLAGGSTAVEPAQCDRRGDPGRHRGAVGLADRALRPEVDGGPGRRRGRAGASGSMLL